MHILTLIVMTANNVRLCRFVNPFIEPSLTHVSIRFQKYGLMDACLVHLLFVIYMYVFIW